MRTLLFACISCITTAAAADPAQLRFGAVAGGTVSSAALVLRTRTEAVHATLTLVLATPSRTDREVALPIALSPGVTVTGLAIGTEVGEPLDPDYGRAEYEETVAQLRDPALVEQLAPGHLWLRAYPVNRDAPMTVTLELAVPPGTPMVIERGASALRTISIDLDGTSTRVPLTVHRTIAVRNAIADASDAPLAGGVDATTALVVLPWRDEGRFRSATLANTVSSRFHPHVAMVPVVPDELAALALAER